MVMELLEMQKQRKEIEYGNSQVTSRWTPPVGRKHNESNLRS